VQNIIIKSCINVCVVNKIVLTHKTKRLKTEKKTCSQKTDIWHCINTVASSTAA